MQKCKQECKKANRNAKECNRNAKKTIFDARQKPRRRKGFERWNAKNAQECKDFDIFFPMVH